MINKIKQFWKWILGITAGVALASTMVIYDGSEPVGDKVATITLEIETSIKSAATYFAEVDKDGTVKRVIVADQEFINTGKVGNPSNWVQTYTNGFKRKNYAGIGHTYNKTRDAFISPKPHPDATLDEDTLRWIYEPYIEPKIHTATST